MTPMGGPDLARCLRLVGVATLVLAVSACSSDVSDTGSRVADTSVAAVSTESESSDGSPQDERVTYPEATGDGMPDPAFTAEDLELWAKLNYTTVMVLSAQGKLPVTYPDTGACKSFEPHLTSIWSDGLGYLRTPGYVSTSFSLEAWPPDLNWPDWKLQDVFHGWREEQASVLAGLLREVSVLCPARYPALIDSLRIPAKYQVFAEQYGLCDGNSYPDWLFCGLNGSIPMIEFVTPYIEDTLAPFVESRTGRSAMLGNEPATTPWTHPLGVFSVYLLWESCQLRHQIALPPTLDDLKKLRQVAEKLRDSFVATEDEYFLIMSSFPLAVVEHYVKNPNAKYVPLSMLTWDSRCTEPDLQYWFAHLGFE